MTPSQLEQIANLFFTILRWLLLARVLLSWIPLKRNNPLVQLIYEVTEPLLAPIRKLMPKSGMALDFSPLLAYFLLYIINGAVISLIRMYF